MIGLPMFALQYMEGYFSHCDVPFGVMYVRNGHLSGGGRDIVSCVRLHASNRLSLLPMSGRVLGRYNPPMSDIEQHTIVVSRTARYYTVGGVDRRIDDLWLVCHGYGQLAGRFVREFEPCDDGRTLIVAPEALSRMYLRGGHGEVGASWMTREDRLNEIDDYIRYLDSIYRSLSLDLPDSDRRATLLGFSQGTATAGRWAARGAARPDRLILWGGLLPPESPFLEPGPVPMDIVYVLGTRDDLVDREELSRQREDLARNGLDAELIEFDGGHRIDRETLVELHRRRYSPPR